MSGLNESSALRTLVMENQRIKLKRNQFVQLHHDSSTLNFVQSGYIKRYQVKENGGESIQVIYGPGDTFPLTPVFKTLFDYDLFTGQEQFFYQTLSETILCGVSQLKLKQAVSDNPLLYKDLMYVTGERLNSNIQRLHNIALPTALARVANQLAYFAEKFGRQEGKSWVIQLPLTHQTLASALNLARETVTHCLADLQRDGVIDHQGRLIRVLDVDALNLKQ